MQPQIHKPNRVTQAERSRGLTRLAAGLTRLASGLRVKTQPPSDRHVLNLPFGRSM